MLHKKLNWLLVIVMLAGLLLLANTGFTKEAPGAGAKHVCAIGGADAFFAVVKNGADLSLIHI